MLLARPHPRLALRLEVLTSGGRTGCRLPHRRIGLSAGLRSPGQQAISRSTSETCPQLLTVTRISVSAVSFFHSIRDAGVIGVGCSECKSPFSRYRKAIPD